MNNQQYRAYMKECALERRLMWMIAIAIILVFGLAYACILMQAAGIWIH